MRKGIRRLIKLGVTAVVLVVVGFACLIGYAKFESSRITLPNLTPNGSSIVLASDGKTVLGHIASADAGKQLTDVQVPALIRQAHMAAEDRGFYTHGPISLPGMAYAIFKDTAGMSFDAGGSTIAQQQAKKYVGSEKSIVRKVDELPYAYRLEHDYTKDQILDMYVNTNYYGRGAYGVEDAAQTWFGVSGGGHSGTELLRSVYRSAWPPCPRRRGLGEGAICSERPSGRAGYSRRADGAAECGRGRQEAFAAQAH
jgi:membrane peptidoglycan carboxypeptidase